MQTSALSLQNLIEQMRDAAARTFDLDLRYHRETDAVLYGKIVQLDGLAEPHYECGSLSSEEFSAIEHAERELNRAFNHLAALVFPVN